MASESEGNARLFDWLRRLAGHKSKKAETVLWLDPSTQGLVRIPAAELAPGMIQTRMNGVDEPVWVEPGFLRLGDIKHPPFPEQVRRELEDMHETLREVYPITFEEWEDGFRRDRTPENEIAIWRHIAEVYRHFALSDADTVSPEMRRDYFRLILSCSNAPRQNIWQVADPGTLSRPEAERVVSAFYTGVFPDEVTRKS